MFFLEETQWRVFHLQLILVRQYCNYMEIKFNPGKCGSNGFLLIMEYITIQSSTWDMCFVLSRLPAGNHPLNHYVPGKHRKVPSC